MSTSDEGTLGQLIGSYRTLRAKLAQKALADLIGVSDVALRHWESDQSKPAAPNLQKLLEVFLDLGIFKSGKEEEEARALWKASGVNVVFAEVWINALTNTRRPKPAKKDQVDAAPAQPLKIPNPAEAAFLDQKIGQISDRSIATPSTHPEIGQDTFQFDGNPLDSYMESTPHLVDTNTQKEENSPISDVQNQDIIVGLEGGPMKKDRRNLTIALTGGPIWISGIGSQDLITEVQRVLHQPSLGSGDKEAKYLEQKVRYYWLDRYNVTIAPVDLVSHVITYVREVTTLLDHSLLPSIRTRLCACLSQGTLLIGVNFYDAGEFQAARACFRTAIDAAYEANHNILQALAWNWEAFSWVHSNETDRYEQALDSMLKASHFANLESDLAVQCAMQADLAEVYVYLKDENACIEALKQASRLSGDEQSDWYHIHQFDAASLNGYRGRCLQDLYRPDAPNRHDLLKEAKQALETRLSEKNLAPLRRAFSVADLAKLYARKGEVESACNYVRQIMGIADASAPLRQRLLIVRTHLQPYANVQVVKDLDREIMALVLPR